MQDVVFINGLRTAIGGFGGSLAQQRPTDLAGDVVRQLLQRTGCASERVGQAVFGNVIHSENADMYLSRVAAIKGGLPETTTALTLNRLCGSGLQAIITAAQQIQLGICDAVIAGGAESMSRAPYHLPSARFGQRMGDSQMVDPMTGVLTCPFNLYHMGVTAENVAERFNVSREDQDALALSSHQRAQKAIEDGRFDSQIVPIEVGKRGKSEQFSRDEHVRFDCKLEQLSTMRPVFKKDGSVTAGNASGINDAAAAVLMTSAAEAERQGLKPMARLVDYHLVGVDPQIMGIGPVPAIRELLQRHQLTVDDIDLFEVNEAFAAQALAVQRELSLPADRLNPNGSGISLGHPIGATGSIIMVKALHELQRIGGRYAVIALCIGGGQGIAALIERC
ncbi:beta-ketothiolase BktB [Marinobacterium sp. MBR-109]|jgi:acetyl-CoA C-acetyltransferase|uniref:beta-ketothiolase BktB n=1 Tax=Marinobacterium sp. MBR-109 TaxID=3156462 RepID=UPI0033970C0B